jgi:hypothetical protein
MLYVSMYESNGLRANFGIGSQNLPFTEDFWASGAVWLTPLIRLCGLPDFHTLQTPPFLSKTRFGLPMADITCIP